MVMIKSKISRITQPKTRKKSPVRRTRSPMAVTFMTSPTLYGNDGSPGQELAEASDVHQDIRMWLALKRCCEKSFFFSSKENSKREKRNMFFFFFPGGGVGWGGGNQKKEKGGKAKLTQIFSWSATRWWDIFNLEWNVPNSPRFSCVLASRKTVGYQFFQTFFVWLNTGGFPFVIDLEGDKKLGFWKVPLALPQISFRKSWKVLRGGRKLQETSGKFRLWIRDSNSVSLAGFGYEVIII